LFHGPTGIALSPDGQALFVADTKNGAIRRIALSEPHHSVTTVATGILVPSAVTVSASGRLFALETGRMRVVEVVNGALRPLGGQGFPGFADGPVAQARFRPEFGLAALSDGSLVVSDTVNYRIRRIRPEGVTTLAGSGRYGTRSGRGDESDIVLPTGIAVGADGTIYVAESGNGAVLAFGL
jgi:sugar lactone lactonase YvrE